MDTNGPNRKIGVATSRTNTLFATDNDVVLYWGTPMDVVTDAEVAMARLAGEVICPGTSHKYPEQYVGMKPPHCLICQGAGMVSIEGRTTDTVRFWIAWARRKHEIDPVAERQEGIRQWRMGE